MHPSTQRLNHEYLQRHKRNGAVTAAACTIPQKSKRAHAWHASYAVLAVMTTLLLLNGCEKQGPAEQAGEQVDQAVQDTKEKVAPLNENGMSENNTAGDNTTQAGPAQEAGRTLDEAREKVGEKIEHAGEALQKQ